ncbi:MAG: hypothetical protein AVDCRST_MAG73-21, partial [uncultured Thermomicrobiales bacterium]
ARPLVHDPGQPQDERPQPDRPLLEPRLSGDLYLDLRRRLWPRRRRLVHGRDRRRGVRAAGRDGGGDGSRRRLRRRAGRRRGRAGGVGGRRARRGAGLRPGGRGRASGDRPRLRRDRRPERPDRRRRHPPGAAGGGRRRDAAGDCRARGDLDRGQLHGLLRPRNPGDEPDELRRDRPLDRVRDLPRARHPAPDQGHAVPALGLHPRPRRLPTAGRGRPIADPDRSGPALVRPPPARQPDPDPGGDPARGAGVSGDRVRHLRLRPQCRNRRQLRQPGHLPDAVPLRRLLRRRQRPGLAPADHPAPPPALPGRCPAGADDPRPGNRRDLAGPAGAGRHLRRRDGGRRPLLPLGRAGGV